MPRPAPVVLPGQHKTEKPSRLNEAILLARVVKTLRRERSPGRALDLLKKYRREFPEGVLTVEAERLEIDAVVELRQPRLLLKTLDRNGRAIEADRLLEPEPVPRNQRLCAPTHRPRGNRS